MISVSDVTAGYVRDNPILKRVSLTVEDGQVVTLLGPNGSGKSTFLKTVMGYIEPSEGEVTINGASMRGVPVHERAIGNGVAYVPQLANVFGPLTVRENLELGGARLKRPDRRARIKELLELYPILGERSRQRADSQSGGERQMLAVARALVTRPRCLLLDEPSAGLSPLMLERVFESLSELRKREDVTILLVEQNAADSLAISDKGVVLVLGEIALSESAGKILDDPRVSELYLGGSPTGLDELGASSTRTPDNADVQT